MNQQILSENPTQETLLFRPFESRAATLKQLEEKIISNRGLLPLINSLGVVLGDTIELCLTNGVNIDINLTTGEKLLLQIFPDDPLNPKLPLDRSVRLSSSLCTILFGKDFKLIQPQHEIHNMSHYEIVLSELEIFKTIALLGNIVA